MVNVLALHRRTSRLHAFQSEPSVGSRSDSYDNALAETIIGLFKTEAVRRHGPSRSLEDVEFATLKWVWWFNYHRLLEPIGDVPPVEYEGDYYRTLEAQAEGVHSIHRVSNNPGAVQPMKTGCSAIGTYPLDSLPSPIEVAALCVQCI